MNPLMTAGAFVALAAALGGIRDDLPDSAQFGAWAGLCGFFFAVVYNLWQRARR